MAQFQFTTFKAPVDSFPLGEMHVGILKPGRYNGFNTLTEDIGLSVFLGHIGINEIKKTNLAQEYIYFGNLFMPTGTIIQETEPIPLEFDDNEGNGLPRIDYVVCEHEYVQIVGGTPAQYLIIKGPDDGTEPVIPNPFKQVLIGKMTIKEKGEAFEDLTWQPVIAPLLGDMTPQQLVTVIQDLIAVGYATEEIAGIIRLASQEDIEERTDSEEDEQLAITLNNIRFLNAGEELSGLVKRATEAEVILGTNTEKFISTIHMRKWGRLRNNIFHDTGSKTIGNDWNGQVIILNGNAGDTPLVTFTLPAGGLAPSFHMRVITRTQAVQFAVEAPTELLIPAGKLPRIDILGETVNLESIKNDGKLFSLDGNLKNASVAPNNIPIGIIWDYYPPDGTLVAFNGTGLGVTGDVIGFALCNGNNGTQDLRGKFIVGYHPGDLDYGLGDTGGSKQVTLDVTQIPPHTHGILGSTDDNAGSGPPYPYARVDGNNTDDPLVTSSTGGGNPHENRPPYFTLVKIQKVA